MLRCKGAEAYTVAFLLAAIRETAYRRISIRSDNEPAILALKGAVREVCTEVEVDIGNPSIVFPEKNQSKSFDFTDEEVDIAKPSAAVPAEFPSKSFDFTEVGDDIEKPSAVEPSCFTSSGVKSPVGENIACIGTSSVP